MKKLLIVAILAAVSVLTTQAQKPFMKFGKIPSADLKMKAYPADTSAAAAILGDYGVTRFVYSADKGWVLNHERHVRIKIFDKSGLDWANFERVLYKSKGGADVDITAIKAYTINIGDGKTEKSKLSRSDVVIEELDKNHDVMKFTMPNVKEGSILEIKYSIEDPFLFTLIPWNFQYPIPVRTSEYHVFIPEYFYYKNWVNGYVSVSKESEVRQETYQFVQGGSISSGGYQSGGVTSFETEVRHWTYKAENVAAFVNEPYITTANDYLSKIEFELLKIEIPGRVYENYTKDWAGINEDLMEDYDFGRQLDNTGHLKDQIELIQSLTSDPVQQIQLAYEHIKNELIWDKRYRIYPTNSIRKAYSDGGGSSADINLNLVALLKGLGLEADAALVSTRLHGKIRPGQVILTQFNHVVAVAFNGEDYFVLDATDPYCPANMLPSNTLNGSGLMVSKKGYKWVDLYSSLPWDERTFCNLTLNENLEFEGTVQRKLSNFAALYTRKKIKSHANENEYLQELEQEMDGLLIDEMKLEDLDSIYKPVSMDLTVVLEDNVTEGGDRLYFNPLLFDRIDENPFKNEERQYPVDYNFPYSKKYTYIIKLPEGYSVEEVPEPVRIALPEEGGSFLYAVRAIGNQLSVQYEYNINQTLYPSTKYPDIKKFYEMMVSRQSEQVVLVKN